jgi:LPXTG-motif cell wall-anchored protein
MTRMKKVFIHLFACCTCLFVVLHSRSQEVYQGLKQTVDMRIDQLGNADLDVSMNLNAAQWDHFKQTTGNNVSLLKRAMERALPKYYLTNFSYAEQPMDRTYEMKFKALGICTMNRDGVWEAKLDTKKPDITKLSDREFVMTEDVLTNGVLVQQTIKLHLPSVAEGTKVEKDSFGKAEITYTTGQDILSKALTALGILLVLLGGWLFYKSSRTAKAKPVPAPVKQLENGPTEEEKKLAIRNAEIEAKESEIKEVSAKGQ